MNSLKFIVFAELWSLILFFNFKFVSRVEQGGIRINKSLCFV